MNIPGGQAWASLKDGLSGLWRWRRKEYPRRTGLGLIEASILSRPRVPGFWNIPGGLAWASLKDERLHHVSRVVQHIPGGLAWASLKPVCDLQSHSGNLHLPGGLAWASLKRDHDEPLGAGPYEYPRRTPGPH